MAFKSPKYHNFSFKYKIGKLLLYKMSRNTFFKYLPILQLESSLDIEVIAAIPREQNINLVCSKFLITYRTEVKFISHTYRIAYCLDMSPSHANVGGKEIVFDQMLESFKTSIEGLSKQV